MLPPAEAARLQYVLTRAVSSQDLSIPLPAQRGQCYQQPAYHEAHTTYGCDGSYEAYTAENERVETATEDQNAGKQKGGTC